MNDGWGFGEILRGEAGQRHRQDRIAADKAFVAFAGQVKDVKLTVADQVAAEV